MWTNKLKDEKLNNLMQILLASHYCSGKQHVLNSILHSQNTSFTGKILKNHSEGFMLVICCAMQYYPDKKMKKTWSLPSECTDLQLRIITAHIPQNSFFTCLFPQRLDMIQDNKKNVKRKVFFFFKGKHTVQHPVLIQKR